MDPPGRTVLDPASISAKLARMDFAAYRRDQNVYALAGDVVDARRNAKTGGHTRQVEDTDGEAAVALAFPRAEAIVDQRWGQIETVANALLAARAGLLGADELRKLRRKMTPDELGS